MKKLLPILLLVAVFQSSAQVNNPVNKYEHTFVAINGKIHFNASTTLELIDATSTRAVCAVNTVDKKVYASVEMGTFKYYNGMMEEDFMECYVESDKFPYAIIDMAIASPIDFTQDGTFDVTLKGTFQLHGVTRQKEIKGRLTIKNGEPYSATAEFDLKPADYKIKYYNVVANKIAPVVKVDVNFTFEKYHLASM